MPGPPPPAPPPPGPPPPSFSMSKLGDGGVPDERGALLKSIRQGAKLKKTVTVDKSGPMIPGKTNNVGNNNSASTGSNNSAPNNFSSPTPNGMPLGGLFAGGMPKLKATGRLGPSAINSSSSTSTSSLNNNNNNNTSPKITPSKNYSSVQDQVKRQLHNLSDTRTRGPPPPAPMRNISVDESKPAKVLSVHSMNGLHLSQTSLHGNVSSLHNNSTLHRKSKSNANLNSLECTDNVNNGGFPPSKPVINHGKPNLAPKPPILNGKPTPPTKLAVKPNKTISRAQSMRTPRSPSPQSPTPSSDASIKFGTVRNMSSLIGQSLTNLNAQSTSPRPRPPLTGRPSVPPPSVPPPSVPPLAAALMKSTTVKAPNHAPPPPPGIPQAPSHAPPPPPPPHKTQTLPQPMRPPPAIPSNNSTNPPPPPPRHSSMRDVNQLSRRTVVDLEDKFRSAFNTPDRFPRPPAYRSVLKLYSNRQESSC